MNENWHKTEKGKKAFLKALNERFSFSEKGMTPKNENSYEPIILSDYLEEDKNESDVVSPYQWNCRLSLETCWYYGLDCASGCIWYLDCIKEFKPLTFLFTEI